jgi:hypothetical protein
MLSGSEMTEEVSFTPQTHCLLCEAESKLVLCYTCAAGAENRQKRRAAERAEAKKARGLAWATKYVNDRIKVYNRKRELEQS